MLCMGHRVNALYPLKSYAAGIDYVEFSCSQLCDGLSGRHHGVSTTMLSKVTACGMDGLHI